MAFPNQQQAPRVGSYRLSWQTVIADAVETLETRTLFCSLHDGDGSVELAPTSSIIQRMLAKTTPKTAVIDHKAGWYKAARKVTIKTTASAASSVPVRTRAVAAAPVTFSANAAGLPLLTSRADGQGLKIFLDFDGYNTDIPFDMTVATGGDGNGATFNPVEQKVIYNAWRDIVSYFSAFNVNVTTVQPATGGTNPVFVWQRITDSVSGGAAYVGAINNNSSMGWTDDYNAISRSSGIAHEIGHQLNLQHQSDWNNDATKLNEYSSGFAAHGPIIGVDYAQQVHKWYYGRNSTSADTMQDDMGKMASYIASKGSYGDGYRPDDFTGTTPATATALTATNGSYQTGGFIERNTDADYFSFTSDGNVFDLNLEPTYESAIAPKLDIYDSTGTLIAAKDDTSYRNLSDNSGEEITLTLPAGTYTARVSGHGDYSDQGEYAFYASPLPDGWSSRDISSSGVGRGGYVTFDAATGTFYQGGGGTGLASGTDAFRFTAEPLLGNASITARVIGLTNVNNSTTQLPTAGLMLRETLAANARFAAVGFRDSGSVYSFRTTAGGSATTTTTTLGTPNWVRVTRSGSIVTLSQSTDGTTFTTVGSVGLSSLAQTAYLGLFNTSGNTKELSDASFDNVAVEGTLSTTVPTFNGLSAPAGLSAAAVTAQSTAVVLNWADGVGETGYAVERSVDGVTWSAVTTTAANVTTYTDNLVFGSMRWWYRLAAADGAGKSVYSDSVSVVNKPAAPTTPQAVTIGTNKLSLTWRDTSGDTGYRIEQSTDNGATYSMLTTVAANIRGYNVTGLAAGASYTYRVTPTSVVGDGVPLVFTGVTALPAVTGLAFTANKAVGNVGLTWTDLAGETGYRVERSLDKTTWASVGTTGANVTAFTDTTATALNHYYYRVFGTVAGGTGLAGNVIFFATPPATPTATPWADADIGSPGGSGAGDVSGATATVIGGGSTIVGSSTDQLNFLYRSLAGDGEIVARVASLDAINASSKAGVMIRESLSSTSKYAAVIYQPSSGGLGTDFTYRSVAGVGTTVDGPTASTYSYLRLVRSGATVTAYASATNGNWTAIGSPVTINMATTVYVGLAVSARDNTYLAKATFDNVAVVTPTPPTLASFAVNDGASAQRSMVKTVSLNFSEPVNVGPGGLVLQQKQPDGTYAAYTGAVTVSPSAFGSYSSVYSLTFSGPGGSIGDGAYRVLVTAASVVNATGVPMAASATYDFHRLYGDVDGDRGVSVNDFNVFAPAFGTISGNSAFVAAFDADGDLGISINDFNQFSSRFGVTV